MKELTEWYAGLSMSSVQSNYVGNSRRQKRPTNLLQTFILLAMMLIVGGGVSWGNEELQQNAMPTEDATYGTNGSWTNSTNTYSWIGSSDNLMPLFELTAGDLSKYERIVFSITKETGDYPYRVCFINNAGTVLGTLTCYNDGNKDLNFTTHNDTKSIDFSQVTSIKIGGASAIGSATIIPSSVKLIAKPKVTFSTPDAFGATIPNGCLTAKIKDTETVVNSGDYIPTGTVVVFTAKQYSNNAAHDPVPASRLVLQGWKINDNETVDKTNIPTTGIVWSDATSTYETTINDDFDIKTEYGFSYVLNINTAEHGSAAAKIGGTDINSYSGFRGNTNVTLTATPADGYALDYWKVHLNGAGGKVWPEDADDENMGSDNPFTLYVDGSTFENKWGNDVYVTPVFKEVVNYTVSFGAIDTSDATTAMGSVTATTSDGTVLTSGDNVEEGTVVTFTATPASTDYLAWGWKENGERNYQGTTVTRTITGNITMNAVFNAGITLSALNPSSTASYGTTRIECSGDRGTSFHTNPGTPNIQFVATPKTGVTFVGWYSDEACNTQVSTDNPYIIANPQEDKTLYALFSLPVGTHAVIWNVKTNNNDGTPEDCEAWFTIQGDDKQYKESVFGIADGKTVSLHATDGVPDFIFARYDVNSEGRWNNKNIDVTINGSDLTVIAHFCSAFTYRATANVPATLHVYRNGSSTEDINGQKQKEWDGLTQVTFSSTAENGLIFTGWYNANEQVSTDNPYTITTPSKTNTTLEARYTIPQPIGGQRVKAQLTNLAKGNVPTWENGHMATNATSYNHVDIFRFPKVTDGNVNVENSANNYTGIRFNVKGATPCRILVYVNGETNTRITNVPAGSADNNKEYVYSWADLGVPASSVANIERVCFAGQQNGPTDVTFSDVWVEKIDDPCHTFVTYGETGGVYNSGTYTYTLATPEGNATAAFSGIAGGDRKDYTNEITLKENLTITAPAGKYLKAVKIVTDVQASDLTFNNGDACSTELTSTDFVGDHEVLWTCGGNPTNVTIYNASETKANIAKIEVIYGTNGAKHPAMSKSGDGYAIDLSKVQAHNWFSLAYDSETNTVYNGKNAIDAGNIYIEFETPQDFTTLSKLVVDYSGTNLATAITFVGKDNEGKDKDLKAYYGIDGTVSINESDRASLIDVTKIVFNDGAGNFGAMKLNSIKLTLGHMAPKAALDCPDVVNVSVGQRFTLKGHATAGENGPNAAFWRLYDENKQNPTDFPGINEANRWSSEITQTATEEGTFYYGIRAHHNCPEGHPGYNQEYNGYQASEPIFVTVNVSKNNIYENLNLDFTGNTYTEDGWAKGRQYRIYIPQSICNGEAEDKANVPVVFSLHGTSNDNDPAKGGVQNFNELAEVHKFIVVYPNGRLNIPGLWGRGWEATGKENEDTKFFRAIIADLKKDRDEFKLGGTKQFTSIDESRIYFTGFSNGGMMAYAVANTDADKFAAFASISGLPMNEMHMRHHNKRPVPFLHIHGTKDTFVKYSHMPTIVDNMLFRNGLPLTPSRIAEGAANGGATRYKMNAYTDEGCMPYYYFEIGTGSNTSDTGMGHDYQCTIGDKSSMQVIWEFFSKGNQSETPFTCPNTVNNPFEFKARINTANNLARDHGWQTNTSSGILAQYGESGGYTQTGENVYHTIHLTNGDKNGKHSIQFTAKGTSTNYVMVKVTKLADFTEFNTMGKHSFAVNENVILNNVAYYVRPETDGGVISIPFEGTEGEYMITITKGGKWDNTTLEDVAIVEGEVNKGVAYDKPVDTNFGGYFNYNNRLFAQWNFDLSDGYRTNARRLQANANIGDDSRAWTANLTNTDYDGKDLKNGTVVFTNYKDLGTDLDDSSKDTDLSTYHELTYNGIYDPNEVNDLIAVAAGLKFKAPAGSVKIYVDITNGQVSGAHLVVNEDVKMYVPYVENSYRNDKDEFTQPQDHVDDFKNCMHHINRDILYIALNQGSIWDEWNNGHFISKGHVKNECIDLDGQDLFRNGGDEYVNGKNYNKADYMGKAGTPCIIRFNRETNIDRIGVNRNLTYSFYTEYISELGQTKPSVRQRIVGSPTGQKIANDGNTWTEYTNAIGFTYGGWKNSSGSNAYKGYYNADVNDDWSQLGVYSTDGFHTWGDMGAAKADSKVPNAIDGFPVVTMSSVPATSEKLMPNTTTDNLYHPADDGTFSITSYQPNVTPWTLPCRGAYAKYEVSFPGVLNADIVMKAGDQYYIADEFGNKITQEVKARRASGDQKVNGSNPYSYTKQSEEKSDYDYVKLSFNVYPGKTYYIFSNTAGMGLSGFYYEPFVYRPAGGGEFDRINVSYREMELSDTENFSKSMERYASALDGSETIHSPNKDSGTVPYTIHWSKDAVKVTLNRSFNKNTWNSICLPYSINQAQMENVFGVGTEVILLRDIRKAGTEGYSNSTINFITHENQDIIAGYPYFIKPTKDVSKVETYACLSDGQRADSPIGGISSTTGLDEKLCIQGFVFTGTFDQISTPENAISIGSYYLTGSGNLAQAKSKAYSIKGYRAWLKYTKPAGGGAAAKVNEALINDIEEIEIEETTGIEEVKTDDVRVKANNVIYNINGQVVSHDISDFRNLPKGIYIINGRKYIAK